QVTNVSPHGPAAQAGIRVGDRIDLSAMSMRDRRHLYGAVYANSATPGEPLSLAVDSGGHRRDVTLRSRVLERTFADNATDVILILSQCAFVLIASLLVLIRPGGMTWAFYIYSISTTGLSTLLNAYVSLPLFVLQFGAASFFGGVRAAAFAIFALRFPRDSVSGWKRGMQTSLIPIAVVLGILGFYAGTAPTVLGRITGGFNAFVAVIDFAVYALGVGAFIFTYARAKRGDRHRIKWIVAGLVTGFAGSVGFDLIRWLLPGAVSIPLYNAMYSLNVFLPITLAYAIVRHRVIDVNFVISRTVVYASVTTVVVALSGVTDWLSSRYFSAAGVGTVAEITVSLGLGFWLDTLHKHVETFVDAVLFRSRRQAEVRLRRLARALPHVGSVEGVAEALVDHASETLRLSSAALFVRDEKTGFVRVRSVGWSDENLAEVGEGDLMIAHLLSERKGIRLHEISWHARNLPEGAAVPVFALPFIVRRELKAFAFYGAHAHGEDIDPDEISALAELAVGASVAFDHIEAEQLRRNTEDAQKRLNALSHDASSRLAPPVLPPLVLPVQEANDQRTAAPPKKRGIVIVGAIFACLLAAFIIGTDLPDLVRPWFPAGVAGVSIDNDDYITRIERSGPGESAGMVVGDRLDTADFTTRIIWGWGSANFSSSPNQKIPVVFIHNGVKRTAMLPTHLEKRSVPDNVFGILASAVGIFMVLTGLGLVLLRPSLMTWGFFAFMLALNPATNVKFVASLPPAGIVAYTSSLLVMFLVGNAGVAVFAVCFPTGRITAFGRRLSALLAVGLIPAGIVYAYYVLVFPLYGITGGRAFSLLTYFITIFAYVISIVAFLDTYAHADPEERQRAKWAIVGFGISFMGLIAGFVASDVSLSALSIPPWVSAGATCTAVLIPLTVGYAVIHYRVVDVRFAISRAFVFAGLTAAIFGVFSTIGWFFDEELSASRMGTFAEIGTALAMGVWLNALHGRIDRVVDAVLFRRRHAAQKRLARLSNGLTHASSMRAIDYALVVDAVEALELASGAVFIRSGSGMYVRRFDLGWPGGTSQTLHPDDTILLEL
ncbi:MAG: hypothetical protein ABI282_07830, partial [Candidatus Baltobacteraceae bacterium]